MELFYIVGLAIIIICMIRGWKKGFVNILGSICATILSFAFFWIMRNWAFDSFLATLLFEHSIMIVRIVLCIVLYIVLFVIIKAIIMSLKIITKLPIIRGLNKILGLITGCVYGLIWVGILTMLYEWIFHI